jgi:hypothetical protein
MMAFDNPNQQQMRAIAAEMSKKSHGTMKHGFDPDLGSDVNDGQVGSGPSGSMGSGTPTRHPLPKPRQGGGR